MDFFEHQDAARRNTRYLVSLFVLATIAIVVVVDIAAGIVFGAVGTDGSGAAAFSGAWFAQNAGLFTGVSIGTVSFIGLSSAYRIASLSGGGNTVARKLGGVQVTPDTQDPLRRRLHNVVEEIAIASGVPVPEVYILEQEAGINAFAAGFNTSDAVVAVTRGTLETLSRAELQGVIAHEFSHILNGDMRLNMRLIGVLFGILALAMIGRTVLRSTRYVRSSRSEKSGSAVAAIVVMGLVLLVAGYVGVFFGRVIKAAVSRQREYLADASAVQFTRQTDGIAGALKKIAATSQGSLLRETETEEVAHMLFATGAKFASLWATHPPLAERIRALDPSFKSEDIERLAAEMYAQRAREFTEEKPLKDEKPAQRGWFPGMIAVTPEAITGSIGNPGFEHIMQAAVLHAAFPAELLAGAHNPGQAVLLTVALLLDKDDKVRTRQLTIIDSRLGEGASEIAAQWFSQVRKLGFEHRLPLLEIVFPVLKQRPIADIQTVLKLCEELMQIDGVVDTFEFTLTGVLKMHLRDAQSPSAAGRGKARIAKLHKPISFLFAAVAGNGHTSEGDAREAYVRGIRRLADADPAIEGELDAGRFPAYSPSAAGGLEEALLALDQLTMQDKAVLVQALVETIVHDGQTTVGEAELLRAICAMIHCPLPPLAPPATPSSD
ncbi:MAG: M48 family metallopeptidase [Gammaproteobacteria bacterium]|nr:M48 family metallopeptidase [Gammaproteobacteria bacterium]